MKIVIELLQERTMKIHPQKAKLKDIKAAETKDLVEVYNLLTGSQIKKFSDRETAERRAWKAIEEANALVKQKPPGKRHEIESRVIQVILKTNPKRPTSLSYKKFELLMEHDGKTVGDYKALEGKYPELDEEKGWPSTVIRWSMNKGDIKLIAQKSIAA